MRYNLYFWTPPTLTPEQEVEIGKHIAITGGRDAWRQKAPYMPAKERERVERNAGAKPNLVNVAVAIGVVVAALGGLAYLAGPRLWIPLAVVSVTIIPYSLSTLLRRAADITSG